MTPSVKQGGCGCDAVSDAADTRATPPDYWRAFKLVVLAVYRACRSRILIGLLYDCVRLLDAAGIARQPGYRDRHIHLRGWSALGWARAGFVTSTAGFTRTTSKRPRCSTTLYFGRQLYMTGTEACLLCTHHHRYQHQPAAAALMRRTLRLLPDDELVWATVIETRIWTVRDHAAVYKRPSDI